MKKLKLNVNDLVKVQVNGMKVQGFIIQILGEKAIVQVPVHYGRINFIEVEAFLDELEVPLKDYEDWERANKR